MGRQSLVSMVADGLLDRIVAGEFPPDSLLPGELDLIAEHDVSRLTVREAIKTLEATGVVRVERGRGTFVNPMSRWTSMESVLRAAAEGASDETVSLQLIALRQIFETGAAALAAPHIDDAQLKELAAHLESMRHAHAVNDVDEFVDADLAFHDVIVHATGNVFLIVLFAPLTRVLAARRRQTSRVVEIQANAIDEHANVIEALKTGDSEAARLAMQHHMEQTLNDLKRYVYRSEAAVVSSR